MCGVKRGGAHTCLLGKGVLCGEGAARDAEGSYTLCDFLRAARRDVRRRPTRAAADDERESSSRIFVRESH